MNAFLAVKVDEPGFEVAFFVFFGLMLVIAGFGIWWLVIDHRRAKLKKEQSRRGFEVKLTSETPVSQAEKQGGRNGDMGQGEPR